MRGLEAGATGAQGLRRAITDVFGSRGVGDVPDAVELELM